MEHVAAEHFELVHEWFKLNESLADLKAKEMELRKQVMANCFPSPKEGSGNKLSLGDGYIVQMDHKISRKLDETAFLASRAQLEADGFETDKLVKTKLELSDTIFKKLNDEQKHTFAQFVTEKPGSGSIKVVKPKRGVE